MHLEQETPEQTSPAIFSIRSEVNLLNLPFFCLAKRGPSKIVEISYSETIRGEDGSIVNVQWNVKSHPSYGSPGAFDWQVFRAIESIITQMPLPISNPIPFSLYEICKRLGIVQSGRNKILIKEALRRITVTPIESKAAFYSKEKEERVNDIFHVYERVIFKDERLPDGQIADTNYLFLGSWYLMNLNALYTKPLDWNYYLSLEGAIAKRLYEIMGVKFYGLPVDIPRLRINYVTLCHLIPLTPMEYRSQANRVFEEAHKRLTETEFFSSVEWEDQGKKNSDWVIYYGPGQRAREEIALARSRAKGFLVDKAPSPELVGELEQRGILRHEAERLVNEFPKERIYTIIDYFDWYKERTRVQNPGGYLVSLIRNKGFMLPIQYLKESQLPHD